MSPEHTPRAIPSESAQGYMAEGGEPHGVFKTPRLVSRAKVITFLCLLDFMSSLKILYLKLFNWYGIPHVTF